MREVNFSEATIARRWREIKPNFREDLIPWTRNRLKHLMGVPLAGSGARSRDVSGAGPQ